jgi:hypothetical protein
MRSMTPHRRTKKEHIKAILQCLSVGLCTLSLSACMLDGTSTWDGTQNEGYFMEAMPDSYNTPPIYTQEYDTSFDAYRSNAEPSRSGVVVPQSYHVGGITNTPPVAKDEDKRWVASQNPNDYTIVINKDSKPSKVANTLQKMPKNEPSVEVRSRSGAYIGLHGNYSNREAAEAQLNNLPPDVKGQAQVKKWDSVQSDIEN